MAKIFYQEDCNLSLLEGKTIAVIGYGSQGHAHALNLHESGIDVVVGLYNGSKSWKKAEDAPLLFGQFKNCHVIVLRKRHIAIDVIADA